MHRQFYTISPCTIFPSRTLHHHQPSLSTHQLMLMTTPALMAPSTPSASLLCNYHQVLKFQSVTSLKPIEQFPSNRASGQDLLSASRVLINLQSIQTTTSVSHQQEVSMATSLMQVPTYSWQMGWGQSRNGSMTTCSSTSIENIYKSIMRKERCGTKRLEKMEDVSMRAVGFGTVFRKNYARRKT